MQKIIFYNILLILSCVLLISQPVLADDLLLVDPLDTGLYSADGTITAQTNCIINSDKSVILAATNEIHLNDGFEVMASTDPNRIFIATIEPDPSNIDYDNDELPDAWELENFGDLSQGRDDDFDGDGMSNYNEWLLSTNPKDPGSMKGPGIYYFYDQNGRITKILEIS